MGVINLLDDLTINKIAAGEVIERPASVVKEMLENSIDAGAKNVTVEVKDGGISQIKITDDGKGLAEDDLDMAFERHATSKIRSADDLINVTSMGFRGEALASIAAISNVEMVSKRAEDTMAHKIVIEGGKVLMTGEAARSTGTTITVNKLFFNTPVRYKFLKKNFTEASYTEDVITRIALVNPGVAIRYINNGKTVIQTNGNGDLTDVVYAIYGRDVANEVIEVNFEFEDYKVVGVVGTPTIARSNRANQLFFVNGRYIKDKSLSAAAEKAYKGKTVQVSGSVNTVDESIWGTPYVRLDADEFGLSTVTCYFSKDDKSTLESLNKGEVITVRGTCGDMGFSDVSVDECSIVK